MSELVVMPKADWQAALDALRAKKEVTDTFKSGDLATAIESIESGSGDWEKYFEERQTDVSLPNATKIKHYAFYYDSTLVNLFMPNVTSIGDYAFRYCSKLEITELPSGLVSIGQYAFGGCYKVLPTIIPASVKTISANAFSMCNLTELTFKGTPTSIASNAFSVCSLLKTINVPWASGAVANAPWGATSATINYNVSV